jgi:hypothetical protein
VSEGTAGQAIAVLGPLAVLTSLSISNLTHGIDRRTVLMGLTLLMIPSGVLVAFAPFRSAWWRSHHASWASSSSRPNLGPFLETGSG